MNRIQFWSGLVILLVLLALLLLISPAEATLGNVVKIVYLHGSLERVSMYAYLAAAVLGLAYLVLRRSPLAAWTQGMAELAIGLWVAEFLISLPAQWLAWGGISLSEPRVSGALWILGLTLVIYFVSRWIGDPLWIAFGAIANAIVVFLVLRGEVNILHPFNPITGSDSPEIRIFYTGIVLTVAAASVLIAWQRAGHIEGVMPATETRPV